MTEKKRVVARKRGRPGKTTTTLDHPKDRSGFSGHSDRLDQFVKRALELKIKGFYHTEIAQQICHEFQLVRVPGISTIADWLKRGGEAVSRDIEELQWQLRMDQYNQLEEMKRKYMALACADHLEITRWVMVEGSLQPSLDENAVKEQLAAAKVVVNLMARQAKLLGLDIEKSITQDGEGPKTLQELQLWMIGQVNITTGGNGGAVDVQSEVLEVKSGVAELGNIDEV